MDNWYHNNIGRGDNFIARIGIKPDSGLITYYCNNRYRTDSMKVDSTAFKNLVGQTQGVVAGGWVGFLLGLES